jgi:uncharacterized protein (TIGR01777 family)
VGIVRWDGRHQGDWAREIDGADAVVNLAGRSVNCRYNKTNLQQMMDSRMDSTRAIGIAIESSAEPPRVWLQMSTATIYSHRFDTDNDEIKGRIGGEEPDAPSYWRFSIDIAQAWERTLGDALTPVTRKVALRTAMLMSPNPGGTFDVFLKLVRWGLGGPVAGGCQYVSWIHDRDFAQAVEFLLEHEDLTGPVNLAAPGPLPHRDFMAALRAVCGRSVALSFPEWMMEIAAFFHRTDTELILKSRRVVPTRLLEAGFSFEFPEWPAAARDLVVRSRSRGA